MVSRNHIILYLHWHEDKTGAKAKHYVHSSQFAHVPAEILRHPVYWQVLPVLPSDGSYRALYTVTDKNELLPPDRLM